MKCGASILLSFVALSFAAHEPDRINSLPGFPAELGYEQFSGYLSGSEDGNYQLHYWFVTAQSDTANAPLVLWLNGGPGCSSMEGLMYENGPFVYAQNGSLIRNEFAWNKLANVLYIESPACVGFSYARDGNCIFDDDSASLMNYNALLSFLKKFPEYTNTPLYLSGESYAGKYIPTLAVRMLKSQSVFTKNLKGVAIGNGYFNAGLVKESWVYFAYVRGIISEAQYQTVVGACCEEGEQMPCAQFGSSLDCAQQMRGIQDRVELENLNTYNIYGHCEMEKNVTKGDIVKAKTLINLGRRAQSENASKYIALCVNAYEVYTFLNSNEVKKSLHISPEVFSREWMLCDEFVNTKYNEDLYYTMAPQLKELLANDVRVLLFYGDADLVCNFNSGVWFLKGMNLQSTQEYGPWNVEGQIGGWWEGYESWKLQFATVRGAGHMVPEDKPKEALYLFNAFLQNNYV